MLKNVSRLEVKKENRTFQFDCESESPLGEVYDALCQMLVFVSQRIQENVPKVEPKPEGSDGVNQ